MYLRRRWRRQAHVSEANGREARHESHLAYGLCERRVQHSLRTALAYAPVIKFNQATTQQHLAQSVASFSQFRKAFCPACNS